VALGFSCCFALTVAALDVAALSTEIVAVLVVAFLAVCAGVAAKVAVPANIIAAAISVPNFFMIFNFLFDNYLIALLLLLKQRYKA
jgi:hypothetical protein